MKRDAAVVVTGIGMRSALGEHAAQSCASVRAGLKGITRWGHFSGGSGRGGDGIAAAFVRPGSEDCPWVEKALRLIKLPLAEALWDARVYDFGSFREEAKAGRVRAFLGTPYPDRRGVEPQAFNDLASTIGKDAFPRETARIELVSLDHVAGLVGVVRACEALLSGEADLCVAGGVDSLLDSVFLRGLLDDGRLKHAGNSSGIIPGEGAAFAVLELAEAAERRGAPVLLRIDAAALDKDEPWAPGAPVSGQGLTRALRGVLDGGARPGSVSRVMNDLNGERWRFLEWALVETRCLSELSRGAARWHPADCLGDVGAAYGPMALCLAARAFARGYGGGGKILITSMSDRGERAAIAVSRPEGIS